VFCDIVCVVLLLLLCYCGCIVVVFDIVGVDVWVGCCSCCNKTYLGVLLMLW